MNELFLTSDGFFNITHNGMERAPFYRGTIGSQHLGNCAKVDNEHHNAWPEALTTANFDNIDDGYKLFNIISNLSTDFPLMVTEFWSGWFDQWKEFGSTLKKILEKGASVNFYMFYGGTNFGFMSGANWVNKTDSYYSDVTSYDYDGILSEAGDVTAKYNATRELIKAYVLNPGEDGSDEFLIYNSTNPLPMELLPLHSDGLGQNFGFTLYSTTYSSGKILNFTSLPKDRAQGWSKGNVLINGFNIGRYWDYGPQQTLYIMIFEVNSSGDEIVFRDTPI
ncbi:hypothetical protein KUTeg_000830, partial [Tegillarca granosa]